MASSLLLLIFAAAVIAISPALPIPYSPVDPNQLQALDSLNIPISNNPCGPPPHSSSTAATCDFSQPFRHLVSLTISDCSNDVELPFAALKSLSTLTSLTFINCPISTVRFPSELTLNLHSFTCIRSLSKLTGVWLSKLQNVTELTVTGVSINASCPSIVLDGMKLLNSVTLSKCDLRGLIPRHLNPNLNVIDLSENNLTGRIPNSLTRLINLVHLNLSSNSLNETIPIAIGDLNSLQNLSLSSNKLSGQIPDSLSSLSELTHLDLGSNQLEGKVPDFLTKLTKLKYLNLENNNFHGILPFNSAFIKQLVVFKVSENSDLCYNISKFGSKSKLGIAPCDRHGKPISPPPAQEPDNGDSDDEDYRNQEQKKHENGPSKVVIGVAIGLSAIVFLIVFLICVSKCCK